MNALVEFDLIRLVDRNGSGDPIYSITRWGVSLFKEKPEIRDATGGLRGEKR